MTSDRDRMPTRWALQFVTFGLVLALVAGPVWVALPVRAATQVDSGCILSGEGPPYLGGITEGRGASCGGSRIVWGESGVTGPGGPAGPLGPRGPRGKAGP